MSIAACTLAPEDGPDEESFLSRQSFRDSGGPHVGDAEHVVDDGSIEDRRDEACPQALDAVHPRGLSREDCARGGLHRDDPDLGSLLLEDAPDPRERAPGAHPGHEGDELVARGVQDLARRGARVRLRVRGVVELTRHEGAPGRAQELLGAATAPAIPWSAGVRTNSAP